MVESGVGGSEDAEVFEECLRAECLRAECLRASVLKFLERVIQAGLRCFCIAGSFSYLWGAIFWTAEASWQADLFLAGVQARDFGRRRRIFWPKGVSGRSVVGNGVSERLLGGFSGWQVSAQCNEGDAMMQ